MNNERRKKIPRKTREMLENIVVESGELENAYWRMAEFLVNSKEKLYTDERDLMKEISIPPSYLKSLMREGLPPEVIAYGRAKMLL